MDIIWDLPLHKYFQNEVIYINTSIWELYICSDKCLIWEEKLFGVYNLNNFFGFEPGKLVGYESYED